MEKWLSGRSEERSDDKTGRGANRTKRRVDHDFFGKRLSSTTGLE
jgi:hypothetical protein